MLNNTKIGKIERKRQAFQPSFILKVLNIMNHLRNNIFLFIVIIITQQAIIAQNQLPHLEKKGKTTELIVNGKPMIILGGELGNSSASTVEYMQPIWGKLKAMHLNTVLIPVYWELLEKGEGKFDYVLLQQLITEARKSQMKIVFLWFASWKNSMSSHVPAWVKLNQERFPRAKDDKNQSQEILTPFSENNLQADLKAFEKLITFIKDFDKNEQTVIMIQVENEIGMLPSARDYHPLANEAFKNNVPTTLMEYLQKNRANLAPEILVRWRQNGFKNSGNWEEIFGRGLATDELFMAWYFAKYTNTITEAGKKIYPIPMFVNAALNRPNKLPGSGYPSAGPLPHVIDVWKAATPAIDLFSPDFYNPDFKHWNDLYTRNGETLFIPEHRFDNTVMAKSLYAIGHYEALGFSPFSIESPEKPQNEPLGKSYSLLEQLMPLIIKQHGQGKIEAVLLDHENKETIINLGKYQFTFRHDYTLGWSPEAKLAEWPITSMLIIQAGEDEFYVAGSGVVVTFKSLENSALNIGILKVDEGYFENNLWKTRRHMNGDQIHQGRHLRISVGDFEIQKLQLYSYK